MLKIGLTGGIGSGKTTVANYFKQLGVKVIDADEIVHQLFKPGNIIYKQIVRHFGDAVLTEQQLDRKKMRAIIFSSPQKRKWLEKLLHPAVYKKMLSIKKSRSPYVILVIPLLLETKKTDIVDRILVIDTSQKKQIERTKARDHTSSAAVKNIIRTQIARKQRLKQADDIIVNNGTIFTLKQQIKKLHHYYKNLL